MLQELLFTIRWPLISHGFTPLGKRYGVFDRSYLSHPNIDLEFQSPQDFCTHWDEVFIVRAS
jgi:hypothetical protein